MSKPAATPRIDTIPVRCMQGKDRFKIEGLSTPRNRDDDCRAVPGPGTGRQTTVDESTHGQQPQETDRRLGAGARKDSEDRWTG